jgi:hypothetical protein
MKKWLIWMVAAVTLVSAAIILLIVLAVSRRSSEESSGQSTGAFKGVSLSPKSFEGSDFTDFFRKAGEAGGTITWTGEWTQLADDKSAANVIMKLAGEYDYEPVILAGMNRLASGEEANLVQAAAGFADTYKPKYLGIGVEVNVWRERAPEDYERLVAAFPQIYDAIKAASPETRVLTIFQLERLKGLRGGLFGGQNDESKSEWDQVARFEKADLIGLTSYPGIIYRDPAEIPADYYQSTADSIDKPIAITESGWASENPAEGWESSEEEQAKFVDLLSERLRPIKPELVIWSFLFDQQLDPPFAGTGLISRDGREKAAWVRWRAAQFAP